ncbi:MAG: hypothetical protein KUG80_04350 [Gammaproteobacteria bacterium]|nr:hypothetical protein [Gammaproteobacteria bacterium]
MMQKTFFAEDMRKALRLVRDDMGAEAVILANKRVPGGVEVAAAITSEESPPAAIFKTTATRRATKVEVKREIESPEPLIPAGAVMSSSPAAQSGQETEQNKNAQAVEAYQYAKPNVSAFEYYNRENDPPVVVNNSEGQVEVENAGVALDAEQKSEYLLQQLKEDEPSSKVETGNSNLQHQDTDFVETERTDFRKAPGFNKNYQHELAEVKTQLDALKALLESSKAAQHPEVLKVKVIVENKLRRMGFSELVSQRVAKKMSPTDSVTLAWKNALETLEQEINCENEILSSRFGCVSFIGSPGAGKTTLVMKLAIEYIQKYGRDDLILVTLDNQRLGASQQLVQLGNMLNVPVFVGEKAERLISRMEPLAGSKKILVDTAGVTALDEYWLEQIQVLKKLPQNSQVTAVLSCTQQYSVLNALIQDYLLLDITGVVFTRVDEATSIAEALSISLENNLPVHLVNDTQKSSMPLIKITPRNLNEILLRKAKRFGLLDMVQERKTLTSAPRTETESDYDYLNSSTESPQGNIMDDIALC